jgi:hypothetical protein
MARSKRLRAFNAICGGKLLPRCQELVYKLLFAHGPQTGTQLDRVIQQAQGTYSCYHKRAEDLEKRGLVARLPNPNGRGMLWKIIDGAMPGPMPRAGKSPYGRPSRDERQIAWSVIEDLRREAMRNKSIDLGSRGAPFEKTLRWIKR